MNSVEKGDQLEEKIFALIQSEIANGRFFFRQECCKIFQKKGYYSKDREKEIIFDIAVEAYLPGSENYSLLVLIECKNYSHPVPVDDAEEFFTKIQQIGAAKTKGIIVSTNSYQEGALTFSKSKGIGLLRYFGQENFKWILNRSFSASRTIKNSDESRQAYYGLSQQDFQSQYLDLYCSSSGKHTNSFWDLFGNLFADDPSSIEIVKKVSTKKAEQLKQVQFLQKEFIEDLSRKILMNIDYASGEVSLSKICHVEVEKTGLKVFENVPPPESIDNQNVLGQIQFDPLEIRIFKQENSHRGRERFTLAHELGHHFLGHAKYISAEYCEENDLKLEENPDIEIHELSRLEWQANYFASSLLLPKAEFENGFYSLAKRLKLIDKGFGLLYVDDQPCNQENYFLITNALKEYFGVSRKVVSNRLQGLGLLTDSRNLSARGSISWNSLFQG